MTDKKHGNIGNSYARHGDVAKSERIAFRCTPELRVRVIADAAKQGLSVPEYLERLIYSS